MFVPSRQPISPHQVQKIRIFMPRDSLIPRLLDESPEGVILYQPGLTAKPEAQVGRSPNQGWWVGSAEGRRKLRYVPVGMA
jgi:hypothetical protein